MDDQTARLASLVAKAQIRAAEEAAGKVQDLDLLSARAVSISTWLDEEIGKRLSPDALTLCRVSKCANEAGEALDASAEIGTR